MRERGLAIPEIEHIGGAVPVVKATPLAASARTNWDGVYTDAQAQRGREVYRRACAVCHLDTLEGDAVSPPLVGPAFLGRFTGQTAHEMVQAVRASMPQNAPDTLGDRAYVDLIASCSTRTADAPAHRNCRSTSPSSRKSSSPPSSAERITGCWRSRTRATPPLNAAPRQVAKRRSIRIPRVESPCAVTQDLSRKMRPQWRWRLALDSAHT